MSRDMTKKISSKRKYDSSHRQAHALESQGHIVETAKQLFIEKGFSGTTIESIALKAEVAPETIYAVFKNKRTILSRAIGLSVGGNGDGNPIPLVVRTYIQEIESERNQYKQIEMFAKRMQMFMSHIAPLVEVMRTAAKTEPEINRLLKKYLDERFQAMGHFVDCLLANGKLQNNLSKLSAVEMIWTLASAEVYNLLINDRGWSAEEYEIWLADTLKRLLLP
jgi:AcrR family transcriptional regulator